MSMKRKASLLAALTLGFVMAFSSAAVSETTFVTIGTGGVTGVYYPTGGAIAGACNRSGTPNRALLYFGVRFFNQESK